MNLLPAMLLVSLLTASPDPWSTGLGRGENACLGFLFEVTFMKIDVAEMEAWLDDNTAAAVAVARNSGRNLGDRVADIMLGAEEIAFRMEFARDGDFSKMRKGMAKNLEGAVRQGLLDEAGKDRVLAGLDGMLGPLQERKAREGDAILYHVTPRAVRVAYFSAEGETLQEEIFTDPAWPAGVKGIFLARGSKFREKWGRSLED